MTDPNTVPEQTAPDPNLAPEQPAPGALTPAEIAAATAAAVEAESRRAARTRPAAAVEAESRRAARTRPASTGSTRFAVYDTDELRYVGGVHDSRPSKADAKSLAAGHAYEIREV